MGCWGQGKVEDPRLALRNRLFHFSIAFPHIRYRAMVSYAILFSSHLPFFLDIKICVTFFPEGGSELVRLLLFFVFRAGWRITFFLLFLSFLFFSTLSAGLFIIVYIIKKTKVRGWSCKFYHLHLHLHDRGRKGDTI